MRILSEADIAALITMPDALRCAELAYRLHASGDASPPVRGDLRRDDPKAGCLMLAGAWGARHLAIKSNVHAYPDGPDAPRLWGSLLSLWDWSGATPRAMLSTRAFNDHRTAAGFGVAARALAPRDASTLAIFGAGKSAPMTIRYLKAVRPTIGKVKLAGRSAERLHALADLVSTWPEFADVTVELASSPESAVRNADLIATVTTSDHPVFPGRAVKAGACVILGGANRPTAREADDDLMRRSDVFADSLHGLADKAGDMKLALESGALTQQRILAEIGACMDAIPALSGSSDVRIFKSMGLAIQDVVLAEHLVTKAEQLGSGTVLDLEGKALQP
jgi:ornithine cyclodeaminase